MLCKKTYFSTMAFALLLLGACHDNGSSSSSDGDGECPSLDCFTAQFKGKASSITFDSHVLVYSRSLGGWLDSPEENREISKDEITSCFFKDSSIAAFKSYRQECKYYYVKYESPTGPLAAVMSKVSKGSVEITDVNISPKMCTNAFEMAYFLVEDCEGLLADGFETSVVYAENGREIEKAFGTWYRADLLK